jgi:integration host factor subunit alpha
MALTKADIAQSLFDELGLNKREARELVDTCFEEMRQALESGHEIKISGFGNFELRNKTERPGRNPKTGKEIPISARRVVTFKPGQKLKSRVEAYVGTRK